LRICFWFYGVFVKKAVQEIRLGRFGKLCSITLRHRRVISWIIVLRICFIFFPSDNPGSDRELSRMSVAIVTEFQSFATKSRADRIEEGIENSSGRASICIRGATGKSGKISVV
jgi:hypothetical protein